MIDIVITNHNKKNVANLASECSLMPNVNNVIVVDDASTDDSIYEVENLNIQNIIIVKNETNLGPAASKLKGVKYCGAPFVCIIDGDDMIPDNFFPTHINSDIIIPNYSINGDILKVPNWTAQNYLRHSSGFNFIGSIIRRDLFDGIEPNEMRCFEDIPTMVQLLLKNPTISKNPVPYIYKPSTDSAWAKCSHEDKIDHFKNIWAICHDLVKDKGYPNSFIFGPNIKFG